MDSIGPGKAVSAGFFGGVTILVVWAVHALFKVEVPPEVASAFTVVIATAATWFTPHGGGQ